MVYLDHSTLVDAFEGKRGDGAQSNLNAELAAIIEDVAAWVSRFGVDLSNFDLSSITDQLLALGQNFLSQIGSLLSSVAGGAASFLGWTLFVLLISFFVLAESGGLREDMFKIDVPGYAEDLRRLVAGGPPRPLGKRAVDDGLGVLAQHGAGFRQVQAWVG